MLSSPRGVATNLHDAGVNDLTIQRVLRHSDVNVTRNCYVKRLPVQAVDAMNVLQAKVETMQKSVRSPNNEECQTSAMEIFRSGAHATAA